MGSVKRRDLSGCWCVLIVAGCFLLGGILGCLLGVCAGEVGTGEIETYLWDFISLVGNRDLKWSVPTVIWNRGRWLIFCGLFGVSAVGIGLLPLLFLLRGILLTFGICCFLRIFGVIGLLPAVLLYGVPALLWVPGFLTLGVFCFRRSLSGLRKTAHTHEKGAGNPGLISSGLLFGLCVVFECGMLPRLLAAAAHILQT